MLTHQYQELISQGFSQAAVRANVRHGQWQRLRRDGYLTSDRVMSAEERHLHLLAATWPQVKPGSIVSHVSAGLLWELPVPRRMLDRVHISRSQVSGGRKGAQLHLHSCPIDPADITRSGGYPVTGWARTVVDLGRICQQAEALVIADVAVRLADRRDELAAQLLASSRRHGIGTMRWALSHANPLAESPGESLSRYWMLVCGVPTPVLQYQVRDGFGALVGRGDFAWPELGVIGEFDGRVKYDDLLAPGESSVDVVMREKNRENRFRQAGWYVYRWTWDDLTAGPVFAKRLAAFLARRTER